MEYWSTHENMIENMIQGSRDLCRRPDRVRRAGPLHQRLRRVRRRRGDDRRRQGEHYLNVRVSRLN